VGATGVRRVNCQRVNASTHQPAKIISRRLFRCWPCPTESLPIQVHKPHGTTCMTPSSLLSNAPSPLSHNFHLFSQLPPPSVSTHPDSHQLLREECDSICPSLVLPRLDTPHLHVFGDVYRDQRSHHSHRPQEDHTIA
jgi:hypothetical protein